MFRKRSTLLFGLLLFGLLANSSDAGWGRGRHRAWSGVDACGDCGEGYGQGPHWVNSYFHGHKLVRFWGGPNHPIPPLSGTPGFWDQPGWFAHDPFMAGQPMQFSSPAPAGQAPGTR